MSKKEELEEKISKVFSMANDMLEIAGVDLRLSKLHLEQPDKIKISSWCCKWSDGGKSGCCGDCC